MSTYEKLLMWLNKQYPTHARAYASDPVIQSAFSAGMQQAMRDAESVEHVPHWQTVAEKESPIMGIVTSEHIRNWMQNEIDALRRHADVISRIYINRGKQ